VVGRELEQGGVRVLAVREDGVEARELVVLMVVVARQGAGRVGLHNGVR